MQNFVDSNRNETKGTKHKRFVKIVIAVVLVILLLLLLRSCVGSKFGSSDVKEGSIVLSEDKPLDPGAFIVFVNSNIFVKDGIANILAQNDVENKNNCYVTLSLEDGTEIYKTDIIKPGEYVDEAKLNKNLDPGKYNSLVVFHVLSENGDEITSITVKSTLTVEE